MSVDDLKRAVAGQGKSFDSYKEEVRLDIMKSKLASSMMRNSVTVSDKEIDSFLAESEGTGHSAPKEGRKLNLSQIVLSLSGRDSAEMDKRVATLEERFKDGDDFDDVARELSEGKDAAEGGNLGDLHEADLSPEIRSAVEGLADGETSKALRVGNSIRFMHVNHWINSADTGTAATAAEASGGSPERREEARAILQQQKVQAKMVNFFTEELMQLHSVDKTFEIAQNK
jgi:peptidyl-prolyl cis-trans isomerase SurA